jgi:hypothetical protein
MLEMGNGTRAPSTRSRAPPSSPSLIAQDIMMLNRMLVASSCSLMGTAGHVTAISSTKQPPSTQSVVGSRFWNFLSYVF